MALRRLSLVLVLAASTALAQTPWQATVTPARKAVLDSITADSLQGHLSFIASDLLEGRDTPSKGLDIAAEYIAAQFRRAGIEPANNGSYFQEGAFARRGETFKARNVAGIVRGSDPELKDTYILVTAHYDHVGVRQGEGDQIYNGANDDGSGTVAVVELAAAVAKMNPKPKRSIVFLTFYGEEKGLLGSRFYGANPLFAIEKTIAQVNLEQIGRYDENGSEPKPNSATLTGIDYSDVGEAFQAAGKALGLDVYKHPANSDAYFGRSDNQALANLGIPAHTLCTAFAYPDYHRPTDHWDKIDYANFAKVVRLVALGVLTMADSDREPRWTDNPRAQSYKRAWQERHGGSP